MNWYNILKQASPAIEHEVNNYTDVLHNPSDMLAPISSVILWFIDADYNIKSISISQLQSDPATQCIHNPPKGDYVTHNTWGDFVSAESGMGAAVLASGRYDVEKGMVSATVDPRALPYEHIDPLGYRRGMNRLTKVLDRAFNNPQIMLF